MRLCTPGRSRIVCVFVNNAGWERVSQPGHISSLPHTPIHLTSYFVSPALLSASQSFFPFFYPPPRRHTYPPATSYAQTVAAGGQEPAGGGCIDLFPAVGAAKNTHTHTAAETGVYKLYRIPNVEAAMVNVNRARGSTQCDFLKSSFIFFPADLWRLVQSPRCAPTQTLNHTH